MPKFIFHMGVNARCYGDVEAEADSIEKAVAMLTADYVSENIAPGETTWDGLTGLSIIDVSDEDGASIDPEYAGTDLPSEYDPPPVLTPISEALAAVRALAATEPCAGNLPILRRAEAALVTLEQSSAVLRDARDLISEALATHIYDEDNGDKIPADDPYSKCVAEIDAILAGA